MTRCPSARSRPFAAPGILVVLAFPITACANPPDEGVTGAPQAATPVPPPELCAQATHDELCSFLPHDVIVDLPLGYSSLGEAEQRPFDNFSWQSFVALNWPADSDGNPLAGPIGASPDAPRVWESYATPLEIFGGREDGAPPVAAAACEGLGEEGASRIVFHLMAKSDHLDIEPGSFLESTGQPLIDRNLNFALYDVRLNPVEVGYIRSNGLDTKAGQAAFQQAGSTVSFPLGSYADPDRRTGGSVGALEVKTAWRILEQENGDDPSRYFTRDGVVFVAAENSESGQAFCFEAKLGLVGFHVIQRTTSPTNFSQDWMWSTFEHLDNAPLAANAAPPTTFEPGPVPCEAPAGAGTTYSFFDAECTGADCVPNQPPEAGEGQPFRWATSPPYAAKYAIDGEFGTQVVRCRSVYGETEELNQAFQQALAGTVWANYRLINTQWQGGVEDPSTENGNVPRFLANTTLETYIQTAASADDASSCLACHSFAKTTAGQDANFSFLLGLAR